MRRDVAAHKDSQSAIAYAMISFAARRTTPDLAALAKAKSLLSRATPDEKLLVQWMTDIQDRNFLPAISSMNDLLKRYPRDKHVLYVTGEWLFLQQDDDHARSLLETALQIDPDFPAALNRLGYLYIRAGYPDPIKALESLRHYAQVEKGSSNPEDSLGEVSRIAGDDQASVQHFEASLRIDPTFLASQEGLGDTRMLMGDFDGARKEYNLALKMSRSPVDELYIKQQRALILFWEGKPAQGHQELAAFAAEAARKKEPNGQFNIALSRAMLAAKPQSELAQLKELSALLEQPLPGMLESDRSIARATVLREQARVAALQGWLANPHKQFPSSKNWQRSRVTLLLELAMKPRAVMFLPRSTISRMPPTHWQRIPIPLWSCSNWLKRRKNSGMRQALRPRGRA